MNTPSTSIDFDDDRPVLLVSPDAARRTTVREAVRALPATVDLRAASGAMQALRAALACPPDLVILDLALDGAGPLALLGQLARISPAPLVWCFGDLETLWACDRPSALRWDRLPDMLDRWVLESRTERVMS